MPETQMTCPKGLSTGLRWPARMRLASGPSQSLCDAWRQLVASLRPKVQAYKTWNRVPSIPAEGPPAYRPEKEKAQSLKEHSSFHWMQPTFLIDPQRIVVCAVIRASHGSQKICSRCSLSEIEANGQSHLFLCLHGLTSSACYYIMTGPIFGDENLIRAALTEAR